MRRARDRYPHGPKPLAGSVRRAAADAQSPVRLMPHAPPSKASPVREPVRAASILGVGPALATRMTHPAASDSVRKNSQGIGVEEHEQSIRVAGQLVWVS